MTTLLAIALGLGLATAAGLRVFVPLFGAGLAANLGLISLHEGFAWLAEPPALMAFGTATVLEVVAYYVPWLDHALDVIATPAAVVAGVLASAAVVTDLPPVLRWGIAIIGGGGAAGLMQALTVGTRVKSTLTTGGLANPLVATAETIGSASIVVLAVFVPVACLLLLVAAGVLAYRWIGRLTWRRRPSH
ncbi:MAG: DUF4126 domain-containing protein [Cytophagaceae bacterium]|nr:DUF4126 domain-containing protein [Gemmatimonadaceae bacterium]